MKRQPLEWEKIFANETTDKGLTFKNIQSAHVAQYKKKKKTKNRQSNQKMGRRSKYIFFQRRHTDS